MAAPGAVLMRQHAAPTQREHAQRNADEPESPHPAQPLAEDEDRDQRHDQRHGARQQRADIGRRHEAHGVGDDEEEDAAGTHEAEHEGA